MTLTFPAKRSGILVLVLLFATGASAGFGWRQKYAVAETMHLPLREFSFAGYPENPAELSVATGRYDGRSLTLVKRDDTHFDFILEPSNAQTARIIWRNVDASLFATSQPRWTRQHPGNQTIALTDREWNRQQVAFDPHSQRVHITGGDGWEATNLYSAEIAKNCLNAGLWEIQLFTHEGGNKAEYYHGWFTFPLGHYRQLVELNSGVRFGDIWSRLEHWRNPEGTRLDLSGLRTVRNEWPCAGLFDPQERVIVGGEQRRKQRTTLARNVRTYHDWYDGRPVAFGAFVKPGRYDNQHPHGQELWRIGSFEKATWRQVNSPATHEPQHELELVFRDTRTGGHNRYIVGGFRADRLPALAMSDYPKGSYMPMGIAVPPLMQSYDELERTPPWTTPYYSVLVDESDRWLNHHDIAVDGQVMHRDDRDPGLLHLYLLSYERHAILAHFRIPMPPVVIDSH